MKQRNVSVEDIGLPSEEVMEPHAAPLKKRTHSSSQNSSSSSSEKSDLGTISAPRSSQSIADDEIASTRSNAANRKRSVAEWKKVPLHPDFKDINSRSNLVTAALFVPVAIVGFGITTMFGFPIPLAGIIAIGLAVGWVLYRSEQKAWYHYSSWVYTTGQSLECDVDLVSSGELDQPYIVLKDENRLSHAYETKVFKVVVGDSKSLLTGRYAPGSKMAFRALVHFEKKPQEQSVIFELAETRLWCRPHLSRGF